MPFDIGKFLETGGKYAYEILSEQEKHKKKLGQIKAEMDAEAEKQNKIATAAYKRAKMVSEIGLLGQDWVPDAQKAIIAGKYGLIPSGVVPSVGVEEKPSRLPGDVTKWPESERLTPAGPGVAPTKARVPTPKEKFVTGLKERRGEISWQKFQGTGEQRNAIEAQSAILSGEIHRQDMMGKPLPGILIGKMTREQATVQVGKYLNRGPTSPYWDKYEGAVLDKMYPKKKPIPPARIRALKENRGARLAARKHLKSKGKPYHQGAINMFIEKNADSPIFKKF